MTWRPDRDFPAPPDGGAEEVGDGFIESPDGAPGGQPSPIEAAGAEILTDVVALTAERDEYLAALQRSQADFANYRKRILRQQEDQADRAALDLVNKLLPVLDTLDLAVADMDRADADGEETTEGAALRQARGQLLDTLAKEGLERVDEVGAAFDPAVHDAVAHAPEDDEADEAGGARIDEVLRSGYRWRGQMLRPAMVRVRG